MLTGKTISELPQLTGVTDTMVLPVELSGVTYHVDYVQIAHKANAAYYNTETQIVSGSNTPSIVLLNTIVNESNIRLVNNSKIYVDLDGTYQLGVSYQLGKATLAGGAATIVFWVRVDGVDVTDSAGEIVLVNNTDKTLPFIPYYFDLTAGQYIELVFASADDTAKVFTVPASSSPYVRPLIPSTYVTINQLS
jgi:hypothetical protein